MHYKNIKGIGLGYRAAHHKSVEQTQPNIPWFEYLADNYLNLRGIEFDQLCKLRQQYPLTQHSVSLSIGSSDPLNRDYLKQLKALKEAIQPAFISDHLAWVSVGGDYLHDLMPLPYTETVINHVAERIDQVQNFFGERILIENVSSYLTYKQSDRSEWEFLNAIAKKSDCYLLLDINNIYVNANNHGFEALDYIKGIDKTRVKQYHLGGHTDRETHLLDTHSARTSEPVWSLYFEALKQIGHLPAAIEWDYDLPDFSVLLEEQQRARELNNEPC